VTTRRGMRTAFSRLYDLEAMQAEDDIDLVMQTESSIRYSTTRMNLSLGVP
jgi:hypothetical protein